MFVGNCFHCVSMRLPKLARKQIFARHFMPHLESVRLLLKPFCFMVLGNSMQFWLIWPKCTTNKFRPNVRDTMQKLKKKPHVWPNERDEKKNRKTTVLNETTRSSVYFQNFTTIIRYAHFISFYIYLNRPLFLNFKYLNPLLSFLWRFYDLQQRISTKMKNKTRKKKYGPPCDTYFVRNTFMVVILLREIVTK